MIEYYSTANEDLFIEALLSDIPQRAVQPAAQFILLDRLHRFPNHPYKVEDNEEMEALRDSIREHGILTPLLVRKMDGREDEYEVISGHRRMHAARMAGLETVPAIVVSMDRNAAAIALVDSNLHRERLLPSEKAFAYKLKMDALKRQGRRTDLTSDQVGPKLTAQEISDSDSATQVKRYIRLTNLIPELLECMDRGEMALTVGEALSYLDEEMQYAVLEAMGEQECTPSLSQACRMKKLFSDGQLTEDDIFDILAEEKPNQRETVKIPLDVLQLFFPDYTPQQIRNAIVRMLEQQKKPQKRGREEER
jgi:ParB family chromosome partitioning protein